MLQEQFQLRISPEEKLMLFKVAQRLERSQSDALRKIIRDTYRSMQQEPIQGKQVQEQEAVSVA